MHQDGFVFLPESTKEAELTNVRMLSDCVAASVYAETACFIIPEERPLDLLTFKRIFSRLREQSGAPSERYLPFEAFERAFERLFFLVQDPEEFDAREFDENGDGYVDWSEFFCVYRSRTISIRLSLCERIFLTMDDPESSLLAAIVSTLVLVAIFVSSLCFMFSTVPEFMEQHPDGQKPPTPQDEFMVVDEACLALFVAEYLLRLITCWSVRSEIIDRERLLELVTSFDAINMPTAPARILDFVFRPSNLIDLAAILPGVITWAGANMDGGGFVVLRLIRLTRIFRVFRNPAFAEPVTVMSRTVVQSIKPLEVLLFQLLLGLAIFGSLMYLVEGQGRWNEERKSYERKVGTAWNSAINEWEDVLEVTPFESIPHAFWWAVVTIFTVGYGDDYPTTKEGYLVAVGTMVFSLVILALPVGVIGGNFEEVWKAVQHEKQENLALREKYVQQITASWARLDPASMCRMMLIEVWNDKGDAQDPMPRPPSSFMGEAKLQMQLPPNRAVIKTETLYLQKNADIVDRPVSGQVTIRYEWQPAPQQEEIVGGEDDYNTTLKDGIPLLEVQGSSSTSGLPSSDFELKGDLRVVVVGARGLLNMDLLRQGGSSNPYCVLYLCPNSPEETSSGSLDGSPLNSVAWHTHTFKESVNPRWHAQRLFNYNWTRPSRGLKRTREISSTLKSWTAPMADLEDTGKISKASTSADSGEKSLGQSAAADDDDALGVLNLVKDFGRELRHVQHELRTLTSRVDSLKALPARGT